MKPVGIIHFLKRFKTNSQGTSLVELALLMPVLLALMGGAVEFGRAFQQHHIANKGVTSAARYLARIVDLGLCPETGGTPNSSVLWAGNVAQAKILAQKGTFDNSKPYLINDWRDGVAESVFTATVECIANPVDSTTNLRAYRGLDPQPIITVRGAFRFRGIGMLGMLSVMQNNEVDTNGWVISAEHEELYIGG